jgi:hypothetical protein
MSILNAAQMRTRALEALERQRTIEKDRAQATRRRNALWKQMYEAAIDGDISLDQPNLKSEDKNYFEKSGLTVLQIDIIGDDNKTYKSKLNQINKTLQQKEKLLATKERQQDKYEDLIFFRNGDEIDRDLLRQWAINYTDFAYISGFDDWFDLDSDEVNVSFSSLTELMELKATAIERKNSDCSDQDIEVIDELIYAIELTEKSYLSSEQWENIALDNDKLSEDISFLKKEIEELEKLSECAQSNCIMYGDNAKTLYSISWTDINHENILESEGYNSNTLFWLATAEGKSTLESVQLMISNAADKGQSKITFAYEKDQDHSLLLTMANNEDIWEVFPTLFDLFSIVKLLDYKVVKLSTTSETGEFELHW